MTQNEYSEHPEFPQASPELKYIVDQVSKIEDAQACGPGYYKSLSKVLARLDKTDVSLNQLNQRIDDLKKIIDFEGVAQAIDNHTNVMSTTVKKGISENNTTIGNDLAVILSEVRRNNDYNARELNDLLKKFDRHISDINNRVIPPLWKIYGYSFLALVVGCIIGKWIL